MKKYSIEEIENKSNSVVEDNSREGSGKTPVVFSKKRKAKKRTKRIIITTILLLLLGGIGWFGFVAYKAMNNVFNGSGPSLLNLFDRKTLKGESDGRVNVLLMGKGDRGHGGENLTDTIMVVSLNTNTKEVSMISVPRDLYVKIDGYGYAKINAANAYGESYKYSGGGTELARQTVSKVLGIPIHYYALVDFTGFQKIIDTIGGVDVNVEKDLYDPLYPGDDGLGGKALYIKAGMQHMNGATALRYARSRETTSDFDRAKRQQQVLAAAKTKILSAQTLLNPAKVTGIMQALGDHIKTDMQFSEGQRLFELGKNVDTSKIINKVIDNSPDGLLVNSSNEAGYVLLPKAGMGNYKDIQNLAKNIFSQGNLSNENASIAVLNGTTTSGIAAKVSEELKNSKFNVTKTDSASNTNYTKTVIYDYSNGSKPNTVKYLKETYNADVLTRSSGGSADIELILGANYNDN